MKLLVTTPTAVVAQFEDVVSLVAEDGSGSFGILDGHADFVTALSPSIVTWQRSDGRTGHCAVRGGVLTSEGGTLVSIATREAVVSDDLERLESDVIARFEARIEEERAARVEAAVLRMKAIRQIVRYLQTPNATRVGGLN